MHCERQEPKCCEGGERSARATCCGVAPVRRPAGVCVRGGLGSEGGPVDADGTEISAGATDGLVNSKDVAPGEGLGQPADETIVVVAGPVEGQGGHVPGRGTTNAVDLLEHVDEDQLSDGWTFPRKLDDTAAFARVPAARHIWTAEPPYAGRPSRVRARRVPGEGRTETRDDLAPNPDLILGVGVGR